MTATAVLDSIRSEKKRKLESEDVKSKKKRKTTTKKATVLPQYQGVDLKDVEVETDLFGGLKFLVASDPKSRTGDVDKKELLTLIRANGGEYVQVAKNNVDLLVVYGGTAMPYDIKLIVNKGVHDVIKPQWIKDCIRKGVLVPMTKKYFFHATQARHGDPDYMTDEDEDEDITESSVEQPQGDSLKSQDEDQEMTVDEPSRGSAAIEEVNPDLADWFKVDRKVDREQEDDEGSVTASETEADSDNEDVKEEDADANDQDDDWLKVPSGSGSVEEESKDSFEVISQSEVKMGEDDAMHYDENLIFKHLCFYLDSPENAKKSGMSMASKHEDKMRKSFEVVAKLITENGGRVVDLDEPKMTHIVLDKRDTSRRIELGKRTSKPKRRNMVISDFIQACLDEETLLDEEAFAP